MKNHNLTQSDEPLVSVIIPFFNRIELLIEAIESVFQQTYKNIELILIDDGSTVSYTLPLKFRLDKRVKLIKQENRGPSSARNLGIKNCLGKFIAFLDSDDLFYPEKIKKQVAIMEKNKLAVLSHTSYKRLSLNKNKQRIVFSGKKKLTYPRIIFKCPIATPTVMVRKSLFDGYFFNESIRVGEDTILWSKLCKKEKIIGIKDVLTIVRVNEKSTIFSKNAWFIGQNNILNYFLKTENNKFIKSYILLQKAWNMYRNHLYKDSLFLFKKFIRKNSLYLSITTILLFIIKKIIRK